jgi:ANTAR domain
VLTADERKDRLALVAPIVANLGQSAIDIVLRRFAEYHDLEGAFGRRAVTERAKGILMERHSVDGAAAFEMLRDQSRRTNIKLADVAAASSTATGCSRSSLTCPKPRASPTGGYSSLSVRRRIGTTLCLVSLGVHNMGASDAAEPTRALRA